MVGSDIPFPSSPAPPKQPTASPNQAAPGPTVVPSQSVTPTSPTIPSARQYVVPIVVFALICGFGWYEFGGSNRPTPEPSPSPFGPSASDLKANVREASREFSHTFGDSLLIYADDIEAKKPQSKAREDHKKRWETARGAAFDKRFSPILDAIIPPDPPGKEPTEKTSDQLKKYCDEIRKIANEFKKQ